MYVNLIDFFNMRLIHCFENRNSYNSFLYLERQRDRRRETDRQIEDFYPPVSSQNAYKSRLDQAESRTEELNPGLPYNCYTLSYLKHPPFAASQYLS